MPVKRLILLSAMLAVGLAAADGPSAKQIMRRVAAYVDAWGDKASIVVATERYTQTVTGSDSEESRHRSLVADFAIVRVEAHRTWLGFRDVHEVDGQPIADRVDRLIDVLTRAEGTLDEARRINDESARFNIGNIERNFNVPTAVLFFFLPDDLDRFKFSKRGQDGDALEIGFRETDRRTLIRTPDGDSVPSAGSLWIDPATGTVRRTHLRITKFIDERAGLGEGSVDIDVTYRRVDALGMWLPETMSESYRASARPGSWNRITGRADYSNYRRFQTSVRVK